LPALRADFENEYHFQNALRAKGLQSIIVLSGKSITSDPKILFLFISPLLSSLYSQGVGSEI